MKKIIGVLLVSTSLMGCGTTYYADRKIDTNKNYTPVTSLISLAYNFGKTTAYSVPRHAREEHEKCVMMMLDNGQVGHSCDWSTDDAYGIVRVVQIKPNLCHDLASTIYYKEKRTSFNDVACYQNNKWKFYNN